MFEVNGKTIRISQGDSGLILFRTDALTPLSKVIFTVKKRNGPVLFRNEWTMDPSVDNVVPTVRFSPAVTQKWPVGEYEWDVRFRFVDLMGDDDVETPVLPSRFEVLRTVGKA